MKMNSRVARSIDARLSGVVMSGKMKAQVLAEVKGETLQLHRKKRFSAGLILALALILLTAGIAVAATTGVFGLMAQKEHGNAALLNTLGRSAAQIGDAQTLPAQDGFLEGSFTVDQAFYDGDVFYLSCLISGMEDQVEMGYIPTAEELAAFQVWDLEMSLPQCLAARLPESGAWGAIVYQTYPSDGVYLESGTYLSPAVGDSERLENGAQASYYRFERPLPDEIRDQSDFTIRYRVYRSKEYYYFDGKTIWYRHAGREEIDLQPVRIPCSGANATQTLSQTFVDYAVTAAVQLSQVDVRVEFTLTGVPESWLNEWDSLERMKDADFIYDYECWINGEKCQQVEGEESRREEALQYTFTYSRPAEIRELRLRPVYSGSGPRETEDLVLETSASLSVS